MPDRVFFDTNVLVYPYDDRDPEKQSRAQELLTSSIEGDAAIISTQVLGEFFNVVTRRIPNPLSVEEAEGVIRLFSIIPVIGIDISMVHRAISTHRRYEIDYWDSLIIAAAERAGCTHVFSEDLNSGQSYHGVTVVNPFQAGV